MRYNTIHHSKLKKKKKKEGKKKKKKNCTATIISGKYGGPTVRGDMYNDKTAIEPHHWLIWEAWNYYHD